MHFIIHNGCKDFIISSESEQCFHTQNVYVYIVHRVRICKYFHIFIVFFYNNCNFGILNPIPPLHMTYMGAFMRSLDKCDREIRRAHCALYSSDANAAPHMILHFLDLMETTPGTIQLKPENTLCMEHYILSHQQTMFHPIRDKTSVDLQQCNYQNWNQLFLPYIKRTLSIIEMNIFRISLLRMLYKDQISHKSSLLETMAWWHWDISITLHIVDRIQQHHRYQ